MHADGGLINQVFVYQAFWNAVDALRQSAPANVPTVRVFVLRNSQLDAEFQEVRPRLMPIMALAGVATPVEVELDVAGGVDAGALSVLRAGSDTPLCALAPIADGRVGCTITIDEAQPTTLNLFAAGQSGGARTVSAGITLPVAAEETPADDALVASAMAEAGRRWADAKARLGDSSAARSETLRVLPTIPGIASATWSPDSLNLVVRFTTGWQGFVIANRPTEEPAAQASASATILRPFHPRPRAIFRSCGDSTPAGEVCCPIDRREVLQGRKVLIWIPGFFLTRYDDVPELLKAFADHACLGFEVTQVLGSAAGVASLATFTSYSTVITSTHGAIDQHGRAGICTADKYDPANPPSRSDLRRGYVNVAGGGEANTENILCVSEDYVARLGGTFAEPSMVFASHCHSSRGRMPQVYLAKGASTYLGFNGVVNGRYTKEFVVPQLFGGLLQHLRTTGNAYDAVSPKIDVYNLSTAFQMFGDREIAYAGKPEVTADDDTIRGGEQATLEVDVEGGGTCEFTNHWHNSAEFGDLAGGNDVESKEVSYVYTAMDVTPGTGTDAVGVEVLPPDSDEPIGVGCSGVTITGSCGDGIRQPEAEECDGLDNLACMGPCTASCTCEPPTPTTLGTTTTTTSSTTTTMPRECSSSGDCGFLGCCAPEGFCCYIGEGCPMPSAGPVFGDGFGVCNYTSNPDPPAPIDFSAVCSGSPSTCPSEAVGVVSYNCHICADGQPYQWLSNSETHENTPYP